MVATPSMAQFLEIKAANPDSLLWYRMGDFYELFFEDAVVASNALGIVLTKRGKHMGEDIPMCGVPVVRADEYLQRLIRFGYRVAVCEQLEDPAEARKRGSKAVVKRDVVRLVTPGTLTEDSLLDAKARNYLTAVFVAPAKGDGADDNRDAALASLDISTGEFEVGAVAFADMAGELVRLSPREVLVSDRSIADPVVTQAIAMAGGSLTPLPAAHFDSLAGERELKSRLQVAELGGFGTFTRGELAAIGAVLKYVALTQIGHMPVVRPPAHVSSQDILIIDAASRSSLELTRTTGGEKTGSLLGAIDRTVTGPGARELAARVATPLRDPVAINARLDAVQTLIDQDTLRADLRKALRSVPDIARAVSRLALNRGSPRDLGAVRDGLVAARDAAQLLAKARTNADLGARLPSGLSRLQERLESAPKGLLDKLTAALVDELPQQKKEGGYVKKGFSPELDEVRSLKESGRQVIARLETEYIALSGVKNLKVKHNNILGYFIEVTQANSAPLLEVPLVETFRHRQTMANAMRFTTAELSETEGKISTAGERALALEAEVFSGIARDIADGEPELSAISAALAEIDVFAALAELAEGDDYVRPLVDTSTAFDIRGGRHPVVEQALRAAHQGPFIANDCLLGRSDMTVQDAGQECEPASDWGAGSVSNANITPPGFDDGRDARIWLVTGPNMAGKSTFLRQNAILVVLAQMGSFVPAQSAHIGIVDRLFSRVGASDDLARGRSTFMVEMVETASILNQATERSIVILDEIGRGTATFDGLSIAWACVEYLHEQSRSRALFATHYHELTVLPGRLAQVANVTIDVKEWRDEIVFLHKVKAGAADRSYGIQVAKLAGLPAGVVSRAAEILAKLEANDRGSTASAGAVLDDLPLFAAARPLNPVAGPGKQSHLEEVIDALNPDDMSPRSALEALYRLKGARHKDTNG